MIDRTTFDLHVSLDNAAMQSPEGLAWTLRKLAEGFDTWAAWPAELVIEGRAKDINGNTVGTWELS